MKQNGVIPETAKRLSGIHLSFNKMGKKMDARLRGHDAVS